MKTPTNSPPQGVAEPSATAHDRHAQDRLFDEHDIATDLEAMFRELLDGPTGRPEAHPCRPMPSPLPMQLILGGERLRLLAGDSAKVAVIVTVPERHRFDDIAFPGQIEAGCQRHGFRIKAFVDDAIQVLAMHVDRPAIPLPSF